MEQESSTFSSDNRQFVPFRSMECVEQAEQVEQETPPECVQGHIGLPDNRPNSFHLFHLFHSPCGTEQITVLPYSCVIRAFAFNLSLKNAIFALLSGEKCPKQKAFIALSSYSKFW